jgi:hypothetical protein
MKNIALTTCVLIALSSCAAYKAQHAVAARPAAAATGAADTRTHEGHEGGAAPATSHRTEPMNLTQATLISEIDKYRADLAANGKYDCCVKPACTQCALTAGECHCRRVVSADGPCCGECTQSWVEGRGNTEGVDREQVLAHLGCVRELYEKKVPEGMEAPAQRKDQ